MCIYRKKEKMIPERLPNGLGGLALLAGALLPLIALLNSQLGQRLGSPALSSAISFGIGTLAQLEFW